jgi:AcrR family transcriptional regulator
MYSIHAPRIAACRGRVLHTAMPPSRSFTTDDIAAAALTVMDRDGLAALSMRSVARELGTGAMTLYRYVEGREGLEQLLLDRMLRDLDLGPVAGQRWQDRVATVLGRARAVLAAHPEAVPLVAIQRGLSPGLSRVGEAVLAALAETGLDGRGRAIAFRALSAFLLGHVVGQRFGPLAGAGTARLSELPRDAFPVLADTASHARSISAEEEFDGGLALVLRGIESELLRIRATPS